MKRFWLWHFAFISVVVLAGCSSTTPTPNQAPTVSLTLNPATGQAPLEVLVVASANDPDGDTLGYVWRIAGEVLEENSSSLVYTFEGAGTFTVAVTVSDGELTDRAEQTITVTAPPEPEPDPEPEPNQAPTAAFVVNLEQAPTITFDGSGSSDPDGNLREFIWDFGDGNTFTGGIVDGERVSHTYTDAGSYTVQLTVVDDEGARSNASQTIVVEADNLRPAGSPDVVIVGFAGRCGIPLIPIINCDAPEDNKPYLSFSPSPATLQAIRDTLVSEGYEVEYQSFAARLSANVPSSSNPPPIGYLEAETYLQRVYMNWIEGFDNPTRVIAVGHSHGTVWMNLLLFNNPEITFDYAISLDGVCFYWWTDHVDSIANYYDGQGFPRPFPLMAGSPCNRIALPNFETLKDINDVMPNNVRVNLEIQAAPLSIPRDDEANYRLDSSRRGIYTIVPSQSHSGDNGVHQRGGVGMNWVGAQLAAIGFLEPGEPVPSSRSIRRRVPAPPGFEYYDAP